MPRRARMYLPGQPYHIVQRGNNREACFVEPENYPYYLELWKENARRYGVAVHAVWDGGHKHSLVQTDRYFLTCCRYIEMNPFVAHMVRKPEEYRWSSYRVNAWGAQRIIFVGVHDLVI